MRLSRAGSYTDYLPLGTSEFIELAGECTVLLYILIAVNSARTRYIMVGGVVLFFNDFGLPAKDLSKPTIN